MSHDKEKKGYSDGHPLDAVHYREYKILLAPEPLASPRGFKDFAKVVRHAAADLDVTLAPDPGAGEEFTTREIVFYDTHNFDLYNHAFILRKRTLFAKGFPTGDPELALKFRHVDIDTAAQVDIRPLDRAGFRVKFKEELLPEHDKVGGIRSLYSHNCVIVTPEVHLDPSVKNITTTFPALQQIELSGRKVALVNHVAIEEVLTELGTLDFGHGVRAKANVALWRRRADQKPLIGEFGFQCKFDRDDERHDKAKKHTEKFFTAFQHLIKDQVLLGVTKTRVVYGLGPGAVTNRE
ncbi:MAG: hypothetical protein ACRERC_16465 [Candidatus Binatia bacterium]